MSTLFSNAFTSLDCQLNRKRSRALKPCKLNTNGDDSIIDAEKARRIAKTEPPYVPTRPRSRALFVGLNCAHPSTMTLQSQVLSLQQESYRPTDLTRHPPGQAISETGTNNFGNTQSNQITKNCHVKYHTEKRYNGKTKSIEVSIQLHTSSAVVTICTTCCDI